MPHALVVEDEQRFSEPLTRMTDRLGFSSRCARSLAEARRLLACEPADLLLLDTSLPDGDGCELLREFEQSGDADQEVIIMSDRADSEAAIEALREQVRDYVRKPLDLGRIQTHLEVISRSCDGWDDGSLVGEPRASAAAGCALGPLIGASPPMQELYRLIRRVAVTEATVLVAGESGTGKELIAQAVHERSRRSRGRFIAVNCGAIPENLIESELFGHERGAFTGASHVRRGVFERASGGTLLLDEITEMPMDMQVRMLRVLESGCFARVGGEREIESDVRVIAATNRDPAQAVREGKLREDLWYRLAVFPMHVPPLRQRGSDVELLAHHFLAELNEQEGCDKRLHPAAVRRLKAYDWPGNVRQLKNMIHRAHILADELIEPGVLPEPSGAEVGEGGGDLRLCVGVSLAEAERQLIHATLNHYQGDKRQAARTLGVSLKTLYNRLNAYRAEQEA